MRRYLSILLALVLVFATVQTDIVLADENVAENAGVQNDNTEPVLGTAEEVQNGVATDNGDTMEMTLTEELTDTIVSTDTVANADTTDVTEDAADTTEGADPAANVDPTDATEDAADTTEGADPAANADISDTSDTTDPSSASASAADADASDIADTAEAGTVSEETDNTVTGSDVTNEGEETQDTENTKVEAFSYEETVDGYVISLSAEPGVLPAGVTVKIEEVSTLDGSDVRALIEKELTKEQQIEKIVTFDISFYDGDEEIEPEKGSVSVVIKLAGDMVNAMDEAEEEASQTSEEMETPETEDTNNDVKPLVGAFADDEGESSVSIGIFHIDDNKIVEQIDSSINEDNEVSFDAESFSLYSIVLYSENLVSSNPSDFTYADYNGGVKITGYIGLDNGQLTIPKTLGGKDVLMICDYVFRNKGFSGQLKFETGSKLQVIGEDAFQGCTGFSGALNLPSSVTSIGSNAFTGCTGITGLTLPNGLEEIGYEAFSGCVGMIGNLTIPGSVTTFSRDAFRGCSGFTSLTLSNGLQKLGQDAFWGCAGIRGTVVIPESMTEIANGAFENCSGITSLRIGSGVTDIGVSAFEGCSGIQTLTIGPNVSTIEGYAFRGCKAIKGNLIVPAGVTRIDTNAFSNCSSITGLSLPDSLTYIGYEAFYGCSSVTGEVRIPSGLTYFGSYAFQRFGNGANIILPEGLTIIGNDAFTDSGIAGKITIPSTLTYISSYAFNNCRRLSSVEIKSNVTKIEGYAFSNCSGLTGTLTVPDTVTVIEGGAFKNCSSFTGLKLSNNLSELGYGAFSNCTGVKGNVTIPTTITSFGDSAFQNFGSPGECTLTLPEGLRYIGSSAFYESGFRGNVTIPSSVRNLPYGCFNYTRYLDGTLTIPSSVTDINNNAFDGMYNISQINNDTSVNIKASDFIAYDDNSYFVKNGTTGAIGRDGTIGKGTYIRNAKLNKPSVSKVSAVSGGLKISWTTSKGARKYQLQQSSGGSWKSLGEVSGTTYTDKSVKSGKSYKYRVRAIAGGSKSLWSSSSAAFYYLAPPKISSVNNNASSVKIKCGKVSGAKGYIFQRRVNGGSWSEVSNQQSTSYTDNKATKNGKKYEYRVYAYTKSGSKTYKSAASAVSGTYFVSKPKISKLTSKSKAMTVKWKKNGSASGYQIQYSLKSNFKNSTKVDVNSKNTTSQKIRNLKKGKTYYVRIRTFKKNGNDKCYSAWSEAKKVKIK